MRRCLYTGPMDIRDALKGQYHAAYRMLADCIDKCPEDEWTSGTFPREFWKVAYHAAFYGHFYMAQGENAFAPWNRHRAKATSLMEDDAVEIDPYSRGELLQYIAEIRGNIDSTIDSLDLETSESGFPWYPNISKLEHELLSIRHLQGHVGQLSERLMQRGIDTHWISRRA